MSYFQKVVLVLVLVLSCGMSQAQNSVAHEWIEVNLEAIRKDLSRPTVHARNLWHTSIAMYDCWAAYDSLARPYFLGDSIGDYSAPFEGVPEPSDILEAREEAISFAAYRMIHHRYTGSPGQVNTFFILDSTMAYLGYDPTFEDTDYTTGIPAALGNYVAQQLISAGFQDGSNEVNDYANQYYQPVNTPLNIDAAHFIGNPNMDSLNRWQPLELTLFCDQGGNPFTVAPEFTSPEWGNVIPFAMSDDTKVTKFRDGNSWNIFHDPGEPPHIGIEGDLQTEEYRWGFELVAKWSGQMDPADTTMIDISPASFGGLTIDDLPQDVSEYPGFYNEEEGGDASTGHEVNPYTGLPYAPQIVKRGDYARILAEYWADGPDSETPPGHWFKIYNQISQGPLFTWSWNGEDSLDHLEYDIKTYFTMGGALHDAAVASWSIKGYYDYPRPVSAIRAMAELGQSSSDTLPNYHPAGLRLDSGRIEFVQIGDTLFDGDTLFIAGPEELNELKIYCWAGPLAEDTCISGFAPDYQTEVAGATWKLAKDWWPYQRPTFVSPPFAGYISGHSTFSRAAAEIMTLTTGDPFFPGGIGEFECPQNNFLVFEEGPSEDITLQWATYSDASDQTSLSRIWGGIHPPCDDIPGRKIGYEIGHDAFALAEVYFNGGIPKVQSISPSSNLISDALAGQDFQFEIAFNMPMDTVAPSIIFSPDISTSLTPSMGEWANDSTYMASFIITDVDVDAGYISVSVDSALNVGGNYMDSYDIEDLLYLDMENPTLTLDINESLETERTFNLIFSEVMDTLMTPQIDFPLESPLDLVMSNGTGQWSSTSEYNISYPVIAGAQLLDIDISISSSTDSVGNTMSTLTELDFFSLDDVAPLVTQATPVVEVVSDVDSGTAGFTYTVDFNEQMDNSVFPAMTFSMDDPMAQTLTLDSMASYWTAGDSTFVFVYDVTDVQEDLTQIDLQVSAARDRLGNVQQELAVTDAYRVDMLNPTLISLEALPMIISNEEVGLAGFELKATFSEVMGGVTPLIDFPSEDPSSTLVLDNVSSDWDSDSSYVFIFEVLEGSQVISGIDVALSTAIDSIGNEMEDLALLDIFSIDILSGLPEINSLDIDLFPNPTTDIVRISNPSEYKIEQLRIYNELGHLVLMKNVDSEFASIDLVDLDSGKYIIVVYVHGEGYASPVIKY